MSPVILILVQLFGPLFVEFIRKLLEKWFNKAAKRLPPGDRFGEATDRDAQLALLGETLKILPAAALLRKRIVRLMMKVVKAEMPQDQAAGLLLGEVARTAD